jgi:hypothetical protein
LPSKGKGGGGEGRGGGGGGRRGEWSILGDLRKADNMDM